MGHYYVMIFLNTFLCSKSLHVIISWETYKTCFMHAKCDWFFGPNVTHSCARSRGLISASGSKVELTKKVDELLHSTNKAWIHWFFVWSTQNSSFNPEFVHLFSWYRPHWCPKSKSQHISRITVLRKLVRRSVRTATTHTSFNSYKITNSNSAYRITSKIRVFLYLVDWKT